MRRVLFLAYFFPPLGGAGTQRSLKLVRDLPRRGYEPVVVTGPGVSSGRWDPEDAALARELPAGVEVIRITGSPPPGGGRADRWLDRETQFARWWVREAIRAARPLLESVDVIYAAMSPYETALAASALADESGLPWVADLRDPWALDEMRVYPTDWHRRRDLTRMRGVLGSARAIVMNTPEAARAMLASFPELGLKPIVSIPNGYDPADFPERPALSGARGGPFRIVHTGSLHTELGERHRKAQRRRRLLGGGAPVDILARSHVHLMAALRRLQRTAPAAARRVELHLAGVLTDADRRRAAGPWTRMHGYLDHPASVALVRSADLLFLPMHDLPAGRRARIVPGKTYEYLGSGRPILAAVPEGDARDLLSAAPATHVCAPTNVDALAAAITAELEHTAAHGPRADTRAPGVERFERGAAAVALAALLDQVVPAAPPRRPAARLTLIS